MIKKVKLFDAFRNAMMTNPKASRKEAFAVFLDTIQSNPTYLELLAEDYFYRAATNWEPQEISKGNFTLAGTPATVQRAEQSAERRATAADRVTAAHETLKARVRAVILLDMTLPTGKKLRDSTGAECAKAGGFYTEVARHIKPSQVVDKHLNERDLQSIQSRYVAGGNKRRTADHGAHAHA